ncbi:hypothetical protein BD779DRAFT_1673736 [Infundibulicybe gibba]|nr:hypothetical protein BD779DRAFT_1673736 [Infundibulicybe gibba]
MRTPHPPPNPAEILLALLNWHACTGSANLASEPPPIADSLIPDADSSAVNISSPKLGPVVEGWKFYQPYYFTTISSVAITIPPLHLPPSSSLQPQSTRPTALLVDSDPATPVNDPTTPATESFTGPTTPATDPTTPVTEPFTDPTTPATDPTAPATEPVTNPTTPATESVTGPTSPPATDPTVPATDPTTSATDPAALFTDATASFTDPTTSFNLPVADATTPVTDPTTSFNLPVTDATAPVTKPFADPTAPATESFTDPTTLVDELGDCRADTSWSGVPRVQRLGRTEGRKQLLVRVRR